MTTQSGLLKEALKRWKSGLSGDWRKFFDGVEPHLNALGDLKTADSHPLPKVSSPLSVAGDAVPPHLTRAFDGLTPETVRVVVIGQDPYPEKEKATGRAFEDGAWKWGQKKKLTGIADSLRPLLLSAAACEIDDFKPTGTGDMETVAAHIADRRLMPPAAPSYFDELAAQGVLFVNAAWTFTPGGDKNKEMHRKAWKPVMARLVQELGQPKRQPSVVFLLLGEKARDRFMSAVCDHETDGLKAINMRVATVYCAHPKAPSGDGRKTYLDYENPLTRVNTALKKLGATPIQWWPRPQPETSA